MSDTCDDVPTVVLLIRERNEARATLAAIRAIVADPGAALVADRVRAALEPTP